MKTTLIITVAIMATLIFAELDSVVDKLHKPNEWRSIAFSILLSLAVTISLILVNQ